ncbi:hypothetical protein AG1IA_02954 [Rhizoctonia solani AG-1 IA]|uniref:Uncharacterized protein n=1 Tax=Thanatephorus cucumeris (strain AG1-IA) TaxID=983506 RepID=L8WYD0_THACA|nr:hypothetical protein AG1IA_02954 [Rhizoctonia solani AG-1 IA]
MRKSINYSISRAAYLFFSLSHVVLPSPNTPPENESRSEKVALADSERLRPLL